MKKYQVIYFSRQGKTEKVAQAISNSLGIQAEDVENAKLKDEAVIFLGSGCYAGKPGKKIIDFIDNNDFNSRDVALFGTSAEGVGKELIAMKEALKSKNAKILGSFYCKGKFLWLNRKHPNEEDLKAAMNFANEIKNIT